MSEFSSTLIRSVRSFAGQLTSLAKSYAPTHLKNKISTSVTESGDNFRITITAKAPDARAQEYGSGLWAQKGSKHWIPIMPINKTMLAFPYPQEKVYPGTRYIDGRIITNEVQHPGIHAVNDEQGYIRPAVKEFRKRIKAKDGLAGDLKRAILNDIRKSFKVE